MAQLITPSSSFGRADTINNRGPVSDDDAMLTKNRMLLLELEQRYILTPGVLTISPSGELKADLSTEDPDQGTMAGLYPNLSPPEGLENQVPSWLRDYLFKELNLFDQGPPSACRALYDQMDASREKTGCNPSVKAAALLLSCAERFLQRSVDELREFVQSGEAVCEESYVMEFRMVEGIVKRLVGCHGVSARKKRMPKDVQLLLEIGGMGMGMKSALDCSLENVIIEPVVILIEKLDFVAKGLRKLQEEGESENRKDGDSDDMSDSGFSGCSP